MNQKKESATVMSGKMKKENRWMNFKGGKAMIQLVRVDYRLLHGQVAFSQMQLEQDRQGVYH